MNPMTQQDDVSDCAPCTAGTSCTQYGLTEHDYPCSSGYYCPGGNHRPNQTGYECPAGTFTDHNNLTAVSQCDTCPETVACKWNNFVTQENRKETFSCCVST